LTFGLPDLSYYACTSINLIIFKLLKYLFSNLITFFSKYYSNVADFQEFELNEKVLCLEMDICLYLNTKCRCVIFVVTLLLFYNQLQSYL
jgi:hypothetical protein